MRILLLTLLLLSSIGLSAQPAPPRWDGMVDGRHLVSFTPFCFTVAYTEFNPGLGFDYEYILSREAGIGLHIPVVLGYEGPEQNDFGSSEYRHTTFYSAPGVRFHAPIGGGKHAEFITGPGVILGNIHFRPSNDYYSTYPRDPYNYSLTGLIADNTINFYNRHFLFGLDLRVGSVFEEHEDTRFFIHFGMHFGGRF